jgi:hypothetical protein
MARTQLEIWIAVDENGDYEVSSTKEDVVTRFGDNVGVGGVLVVYQLTVDVPLPEVREASVTLKDDAPVEIITTVVE